jgi:hypothetical protein
MLAMAARLNAQLPAQPHVKVELVSEQSVSAPGQPPWVGLLFQLDQGWHIYWQNPGAAFQLLGTASCLHQSNVCRPGLTRISNTSALQAAYAWHWASGVQSDRP